MRKKYHVALTDAERDQLSALVALSQEPGRKLARARILLLADAGTPDAEIAEVLHVGLRTVTRIRQRFAEGRLGQALSDRPRPGCRPKLDARQEGLLLALARSAPPEGHTRWTPQLLADELVRQAITPAISDETVRRILKRYTSRRPPAREPA